VIGWGRKRKRWWAALVLPGLLLRALIPLGFMPMFGPGYSVGLMLCPAYAPIPDPVAIKSSTGPARNASTDTSVGMSSMSDRMDMSAGMDMSMDMPVATRAGDAADLPARSGHGGSSPGPGSPSGNRTDHQDHGLFHYRAGSVLAFVPTWLFVSGAEQSLIALALPAPQIAYFQVPARAQSARAPPDLA
jgi:hypothetical protein